MIKDTIGAFTQICNIYRQFTITCNLSRRDKKIDQQAPL